MMILQKSYAIFEKEAIASDCCISVVKGSLRTRKEGDSVKEEGDILRCGLQVVCPGELQKLHLTVLLLQFENCSTATSDRTKRANN